MLWHWRCQLIKLHVVIKLQVNVHGHSCITPICAHAHDHHKSYDAAHSTMSAEALAHQVSVLKENLVDVAARLQQHTEAARSASVALAKVTGERQQQRQEAASVQAEVAALECQASDWTVLAKRRGSEQASFAADSSVSLADTLKVRR